MLLEGSSLAELMLAGDPQKLSPLWNPNRVARELGQPARTGGTGHFVCVDGFGPVSDAERAAGLPFHGEAQREVFEVVHSGKDGHTLTVTLKAKLPIVQETFARTFRMVDGESVIYVESELENLLGFDRPVSWAEHATIGSPFLEPGVTVVDLSGKRSRTRTYAQANMGQTERRLASGKDFDWPAGPGLNGEAVDLRAAPREPHHLDHATTLLDPTRELEWVTALHPGKRLVFGYVFKRAKYPWLQYWGYYPPTGKLARGLEFSAQPFDVPRRETITMGSLFETPAYRWLPAKSKIGSRFLVFYAPVPEGFTRVDDVRVEGGQVVVEDKAAGKVVRLAASLPL